MRPCHTQVRVSESGEAVAAMAMPGPPRGISLAAGGRLVFSGTKARNA